MKMADVTLYHFPGSYYSLKVLLALYEKNASFKEQVVNIHDPEQPQSQEWYLRINKDGEVPVLKIGDRCISQSEDIIDVIDKTFTSGPCLVPNVETGVGREIADFRKRLQEIPIDIITFGTAANPQFRVTDIGVPKLLTIAFRSRERTEHHFLTFERTLRKQIETAPVELRPRIEEKLAKVTHRRTHMLSETEVGFQLDQLEAVFDRIADLLEKSKKGSHGEVNVWLFGSEITAADISAVNLMFRLEVIGVCARYASLEVRPGVFDYYNRMKERPTVDKMMKMFDRVQGIYMKMAAKVIGKKVLKIGLVVGLVAIGYLGFREYTKMSKGLGKA